MARSLLEFYRLRPRWVVNRLGVKQEKKQLVVLVTHDLHTRIKCAAARNREPMCALVERAVERELGKEETHNGL